MSDLRERIAEIVADCARNYAHMAAFRNAAADRIMALLDTADTERRTNESA